jgi:hypothetical protein
MTPTDLDMLERAVLEKLLDGEARVLTELRQQLSVSRVEDRDLTGHGFFTTLAVDGSQSQSAGWSGRIGDVQAEIEGLNHGAGFVLTIEDGYLQTLEGYSYEEPWPSEVSAFSVSYTKEPRDLDFLES